MRPVGFAVSIDKYCSVRENVTQSGTTTRASGLFNEIPTLVSRLRLVRFERNLREVRSVRTKNSARK